MRDEYDFRKAKRGAVVAEPGKTRITIRIDSDILEWFRTQVQDGGNYQTLMNAALKAYKEEREGTLERLLRRVIREELKT